MKKTSLVIALFIAIGAFAQKHHPKKDSFTVEQKIQLMIKKLSVELDLTPKQVAKITPIVVEKANKMEVKKAEFESNKGEHKHDRKMLSNDEKFKMAMDRLDEQETLQNKMKNILDKDQYAAWKKIHKKHGKKRKKANCEDSSTREGDHKGKRRHKHIELDDIDA